MYGRATCCSTVVAPAAPTEVANAARKDRSNCAVTLPAEGQLEQSLLRRENMAYGHRAVPLP